MIKVHTEKLNRQIEGINKWRSSSLYGASANGLGTWWWVTGMGKTYGACIIINELIKKNSATSIIVIVPSAELLKQWKREVINFVGLENSKKIEIFTIDKIMENKYRMECTFLVLDEVHEYLTDERIKIIDNTLIKAKFKLGLTATWQDKQERQKLIEQYIPVIDKIDEIEAEEKGFISKSIEYNIGVELSVSELSDYKNHTEVINKHMNKFGKGNPLGLASKVLGGEGNVKGFSFACAIAQANGWHQGMDLTNETNQHIFDLWHPKKIQGYAAQLMEGIRERKNILYNAQNKLYIAKELFFKFDKLKTIFFSQSTIFADRLAYIINEHHQLITNSKEKTCVSYHSNIETQIIFDTKKNKEVKLGKIKLKKLAIDGIHSGKYRGLSTASSLDRGYDEPSIGLGITTSGTQNPTQYIQRKGRTTRKDEDVIKLIINIYVKNTKDEEWLRKRQSKVKTIVYWCDNTNDINYIPKSQDSFNLNDF